MTATPAPPTGRQQSLDMLRALAIALMVVVHFAENLSGSYGIDGGPMIGANRIWWLPTGFAAPIFTFLSGVNYRLWAAAQVRRGRGDEAISKITIRRGLFLFGLGFAFNVLVWLPEDTFNWDILTFTGSALVALDVVRRMPSEVAVAACILVLLASPVLRVWIVYPVVGYLAAGRLFPAEIHGRPAKGRGPGGVGLALIAAAAVLLVTEPLLPTGLGRTGTHFWTMFPASTPYVLGTLGTALAAAAFLRRIVDRPSPPAWARTIAPWTGACSRHALSIYLLHHMVHVWPLWAAGLAAGGDDATIYWQRALPVWQSLLLAAVFLVGAAVVFRWVDRRRLPSVESLMRWLCD